MTIGEAVMEQVKKLREQESRRSEAILQRLRELAQFQALERIDSNESAPSA